MVSADVWCTNVPPRKDRQRERVSGRFIRIRVRLLLFPGKHFPSSVSKGNSECHCQHASASCSWQFSFMKDAERVPSCLLRKHAPIRRFEQKLSRHVCVCFTNVAKGQCQVILKRLLSLVNCNKAITPRNMLNSSGCGVFERDVTLVRRSVGGISCARFTKD